MLEANALDANGEKVRKLSDEEIIGQSIGFMLAGYETTSSALAFTTYCLALNPDKQEKLLQEVDETIREDGVGINSFTLTFKTYVLP